MTQHLGIQDQNLVSERGSQIYEFDDHLYCYHKEYLSTTTGVLSTYYRCVSRDCRGRLTTKGTWPHFESIDMTVDHTCFIDASNIIMKKAESKMQILMVSGHNSIADVYALGYFMLLLLCLLLFLLRNKQITKTRINTSFSRTSRTLWR
jgi:hypothetical protein